MRCSIFCYMQHETLCMSLFVIVMYISLFVFVLDVSNIVSMLHMNPCPEVF